LFTGVGSTELLGRWHMLKPNDFTRMMLPDRRHYTFDLIKRRAKHRIREPCDVEAVLDEATVLLRGHGVGTHPNSTIEASRYVNRLHSGLSLNGKVHHDFPRPNSI
jgi:hypothetical protein